MAWDIVAVPGIQTSSPGISTVDVIAATIEPNLASVLVRKLNQACPLEDLHHVKRVRKIVTAEGVTQLSIIICRSNGEENCMKALSEKVVNLVDTYNLSPYNAKVAMYAATTKEEWEEQCKYWPTSYHPPNNQDAISELGEEEAQSFGDFMKIAMELTKSGFATNEVTNAAVIVDPQAKQIVAKATDQTRQYQTSKKDSDSDQISSVCITSSSSQCAETFDRLIHSCSGVACINPWSWIKPRDCQGTSTDECVPWHPLRHAALVAIERAALRDMKLFPGGAAPCMYADEEEHCSINGPAKRQKTKNDADLNTPEAVRPYLCTGFDMYLVWEPCAMCAMALVHQRFRRIFYAFPNKSAGALGSVHRLHGQKSLNHHYSVYQILVPTDAFDQLHAQHE